MTIISAACRRILIFPPGLQRERDVGISDIIYVKLHNS